MNRKYEPASEMLHISVKQLIYLDQGLWYKGANKTDLWRDHFFQAEVGSKLSGPKVLEPDDLPLAAYRS